MRAKRTIHAICAISAISSLFGCGSGVGAEEHSSAQGDTSSSQVVRALGKDQVRAVLPDSDDVPPGWEKSGTLSLDGANPEDGGSLAYGRQGYAATDLEGTVGFGLQSFRNRAQAIDRYTESKSKMASAQVGPAQFPDVDAAFTASYCIGTTGGRTCNTSITLRLDSVFAYVAINTVGPATAADPKVLNSVTRMFAQRIRQAQHGQPPSAKAT